MPFRVGGKGGSGGGAVAVPTDLRFAGANLAACQTARDTFFTNNPSRKVKDVRILLEPSGAAIVLQEWDGASTWKDMTSIVRGPQGDIASNLVQSVNGQTGVVSITKTTLNLGNVDNTSDLAKPISTLTQNALDTKASTVHSHVTADITGLDTTLSNINTAVSNKQDKLISGTNIKTINGNSILGSGNVVIDAVQDATSAVTGGVRLTGDLGGSATAPKVEKINGITVSNSGVLTGKVLRATSATTSAFETITAADVGAIPTSAKGVNDGVAELDANGKLPSARLPSGIVQSVNGYTGTVVITKSDLSLGSVDNTADVDKPLSNDTKTALNLKVDKTSIGANSGVCELDSNGKIPSSRISALPTGETFVVANAAARLALSAAKGDVAIQQDTEESYRLKDVPATLPANWVKLLFPASVQSVNSKTGNVTITKADLNLGNVDNTTDLAKPISADTQTALNTKVDKTVLSAKGSLLTHTGSALTPHAVGTDGYVLKSDSTSPTGLKWEALPSALVINNTLASDSTTESLSAAQGKALKLLVDAKPALTTDITPLAPNGIPKVGTSQLAARADHVHPETGIAATNFTQMGQMLVGTGAGTYGQVNLGSIGQVLTVDPTSIHTGIAWRSLGNATALVDGLMSSAHYTKLEGLSNTTINDTLTSTSSTQALSANQGKLLNDNKANLASPTFTGTPLAPTAAADTNTTQIATTAFVLGQAGAAPSNTASAAAAGSSLKYARQDHVHRHPDSLHNGTRTVAQFTTGDYWIESLTANKSKITLSDTLVSASVENVLRFRADATDVRLSGPKGIDKAYAGTGAEGIGLSVSDADFRVRHANLDMGGTDTAIGGWYFKTKNTWGEFKLNEATNGVNCTLASGKGGVANLAVKNGTRLWFDDNISTLEFNSANGTNNNVDKWSRLRCIRDNIESVVNGNTTLTVKQGEIRVAGELYPSGNGTRFLGWSGDRWKEIWCTQASINSSSDARLKTELESIPEALLDGWGLHVKWGSFNWLDLKDSRKQLGLIAQDVIKAFEYAGLDWKEWAAIAGDEDLDKGGFAAMYGALQVIENAYQRRRLDRIEKALGLV